jgi:tetraacyldisaccharide 4'-kinase
LLKEEAASIGEEAASIEEKAAIEHGEAESHDDSCSTRAEDFRATLLGPAMDASKESGFSETWLERLWYAPRPGGPLVVLAPLLKLASLVFGAGVALRARLLRLPFLRPVRASAHVISVGNLNVGGAGKTPVVIALAERLCAAGARVAVLSRGYGGAGKEAVVSDGITLRLGARDVGDEPVLIARRVPAAVVLVGPSRVRLAERAVAQFGSTVLILDDGFQHRSLARDEDILVLGGAHPLGNGALLPWGPLREPASAAARASLAWLSNLPDDEPLPAGLPARQVRTRTRVVDVTDWHLRESFGAGALQGQRVFLLAGLARPSGFARTLAELGAEVVGSELVGDHHPYSNQELAAVARSAARIGAACVVTTEKDAVRMEKTNLLPVPIRVVKVDLEITSGAELVDRLVADRSNPALEVTRP